MNFLLVILINLISSLIRWSSTPKPTLGLDCTYSHAVSGGKGRRAVSGWDQEGGAGREGAPHCVGSRGRQVRREVRVNKCYLYMRWAFFWAVS